MHDWFLASEHVFSGEVLLDGVFGFLGGSNTLIIAPKR